MTESSTSLLKLALLPKLQVVKILELEQLFKISISIIKISNTLSVGFQYIYIYIYIYIWERKGGKMVTLENEKVSALYNRI
jgi:hypothetical protein